MPINRAPGGSFPRSYAENNKEVVLLVVENAAGQVLRKLQDRCSPSMVNRLICSASEVII